MDKFHFDSAKHEYWVNNQKVPSVTEIVMTVYGNSYPTDEFYLRKGSMLHLAISLYLQDNLDETTVDKRIAGQLDGAKMAISQLNLKPSLIEKHLYHPIFQYGGTPDLLTQDGILIDWKTSPSRLTTPAQLGGYLLLLTAWQHPVKKTFEIALQDKNYKLTEYNMQYCKNLFLATLTVYNHKRKEE